MNIIIKDLDRQAHREIFNTIGNYCQVLPNTETPNTVDVELNECVIVKTHLDSVTLDYGGKIATVDKNEFVIIHIY